MMFIKFKEVNEKTIGIYSGYRNIGYIELYLGSWHLTSLIFGKFPGVLDSPHMAYDEELMKTITSKIRELNSELNVEKVKKINSEIDIELNREFSK